jgi:hypothetical protein
MGGNVAGMGKKEMQTEFRWDNLKEWDHVEDLGSDGVVILKTILRE